MKRTSPLMAIKANCIDCMGGQNQEVPLCQIQDCPLWPYRLGLNPRSPRYHDRVKTAWATRGEQRKAVEDMGLMLASFLPVAVQHGVFKGKTKSQGKGAG